MCPLPVACKGSKAPLCSCGLIRPLRRKNIGKCETRNMDSDHACQASHSNFESKPPIHHHHPAPQDKEDWINAVGRAIVKHSRRWVGACCGSRGGYIGRQLPRP